MANEQTPAAVALNDQDAAGPVKHRSPDGSGQLRPVSGFAPKGTHDALQALAAEHARERANATKAKGAPPPAPTVELLPHEVSVAPVRWARPPEHRRTTITVAVIVLAVALGAALGYALRNTRSVSGRRGTEVSLEAQPVPERTPESEFTPSARPTVTPAPVTERPDMVVSVEAIDAMPEHGEKVEEASKSGPAPVTKTAPEPQVVRVPAPPSAPSKPEPVEDTRSEAPRPDFPSRDEVVAGFEGVRLRLAACAAGRPGVAEVHATIAGTGRVTHALIAGDFQGTPQGSCMARAVRTARFPSFASATLKVEYPFAL